MSLPVRDAVIPAQSEEESFLYVLGKNLPAELTDELMRGWRKNPAALQRALKAALCPPEIASGLEPWWTVFLGKLPSTAHYVRALKRVRGTDMMISPSAISALAQISLSPQHVLITLAKMSYAELGFAGPPRIEELHDRIIHLGGKPLPMEAGPALRLAYPKGRVWQSNLEKLMILTDLDEDDEGVFGLLAPVVGRLKLEYGASNPKKMDSDVEWVFEIGRQLVS
ncbi:MAG: hypothetical protein WD898_01365 [Candidatus Paceibacterota bacterium]